MKSRTNSRLRRVADLIQRAISEIIAREIKDPRLPSFITVSHVVVSPDVSVAKVYFTLFEKHDKTAVARLLNKAAPFMRSQLASRVQLRHVPELRFYYDETQERAARIDQLLSDKADKFPDDSE